MFVFKTQFASLFYALFTQSQEEKQLLVSLFVFYKKQTKNYLNEPKNFPANPPKMKSMVPVMMIREAKKIKTPTIMRPV